MQVSNDDQKGKTKWRLTWKRKNRLDLPISTIKDMGVLTNVKSKTKVIELLDM
jgi:hypothetical protein